MAQVERIPSDRLGKHVVEYKAGGQDIKITGSMVMRYLVQGKWEYIEENELVYFLQTCKALELNPFIKECYLIKYSPGDNAAIVVAAQTFRDRAMAHPMCQGWSKGLILWSQEDKQMVRTTGIVLPEHQLIGAWFEATPKNWKEPYKHEVQLTGYIKKKSDGSVTRFWSESNQPSQIMKVAEAQGLRHLFGTSLRGLYVAAELLREMEDQPGDVPSAAKAAAGAAAAAAVSKDFSIYEPKEGQKVQPEKEPEPETVPEPEPDTFDCSVCKKKFEGAPAYSDRLGDVCSACANKEGLLEPDQNQEAEGEPLPDDEATGAVDTIIDDHIAAGEQAAAEGEGTATGHQLKGSDDIDMENEMGADMALEMLADCATQLKQMDVDDLLIAGFQDHLKSVARTTKRDLGAVAADAASDIAPMFDGFCQRLKDSNYLGYDDKQRKRLLRALPAQGKDDPAHDPCRPANFMQLRSGLENYVKLNAKAFLKDENRLCREIAKEKWEAMGSTSGPFPLDKYDQPGGANGSLSDDSLRRKLAQMKAEEPDLFKAAIKNQDLLGKMFSEFSRKELLAVIEDVEGQKELRDRF